MRLYDKLTRSKIHFVHTVLNMGYDVFFTDVDIGYFADPWYEVLNFEYENCQWIVQRNDCIEGRNHGIMGDEPNTGFYFIRSSPKTIRFLKHVSNQKGSKHTIHLL